eukprot:TRINITY_DN4858_c0_g1_i6.p1 TRINITY_DN4858_c0_g1~~TRINITY_DN4858_c0_g1_i6.p1  ORF type:complete len:334 (+),score=55.73 TRINITY_DN4858_c0_g1_i6:95-1096(+)
MGSGAPPNYAFGFLMAVVAGLSTVTGVSFVFLLKCGEYAHRRVTAGALGFAAGVMLYVSFVDVLGDEAKEYFEGHVAKRGTAAHEAHEHSQEARIWTAVFFFIGIAIAMAMDVFIGDHEDGDDSAVKEDTRDVRLTQALEDGVNVPYEKDTRKEDTRASGVVHSASTLNDGESDAANASLKRVSMVAFLALMLHNFPEGVATFFGAADLNYAVPFAIAMHNIPEGAAIAIPRYQLTGSFRATLRANIMAGCAQPTGALFAWLIMSGLGMEEVPDFLYGAMYASTAGIMVCVSLLELIPEALRGAPPFFVGCCIWSGFLLMEASIICLGYAGID